MNTASREWCDRVAARNAIEVAKAQRVWQPGLFTQENPEWSGRELVLLSAEGKEAER